MLFDGSNWLMDNASKVIDKLIDNEINILDKIMFDILLQIKKIKK